MFVEINIDGTGICNADSGIPFLDHMLDVRLAPHMRPDFFCPQAAYGRRQQRLCSYAYR